MFFDRATNIGKGGADQIEGESNKTVAIGVGFLLLRPHVMIKRLQRYGSSFY